MSKRKFKTEVKQILDLVIHSLYSHREIFLRELISNSSDALDKLKYQTLTDEKLKSLNFQPEIDITISEDGKTLQISDNGIGMNEEDLAQNLGTIASSGTKKFLSSLSAEQKQDSNLIGQFGVGFYSSFMVADKVEVLSRKAGEDKAFLWISDGSEEYQIKEGQRESQGTTVSLHLNEDGSEYSNRWQLEGIISKYSNHIAFPIFVSSFETKEEGKKELERKQANSASALWKRPKSEISEEDYKEFFQSLAHDNCAPALTIHTKAEGSLEYTSLFFIPETAPFDLYQADYRSGLKLYVRRVFISDDNREFLPVYLRFVRGIIDSEDLPLNVSREILQQNKVMNQIRTASVKKILSELANLAKNNAEKYSQFIDSYNRPLKEGLYSDYAHKTELQELIRFKSTKVEGWTSLADYRSRMIENQKSIYFITGTKASQLRHSPLLEAYEKKGIEVLLLDDEIDEFIAPQLGPYDGVEIKSVNRSDSAEELKSEEDKKDQEAQDKEFSKLLEKCKEVLQEQVKDVALSARLTESPACIVNDQNDPSAQLQQMMKAMGQDIPEAKPILELNPDHIIVTKLREYAEQDDKEDLFKQYSHLILDQAFLSAGLALKDPLATAERINTLVKNVI